jgi:hypothetical protein
MKTILLTGWVDAQYYPMYFIFDKEGNLVQHHA